MGRIQLLLQQIAGNLLASSPLFLSANNPHLVIKILHWEQWAKRQISLLKLDE